MIIQIELEEKDYKAKELAEWFGVTPKAFTNSKQKYLEKLSEYAEFQVIYGSSGRINKIAVTEVKEPIYGNLDTKTAFLEWLPANINEIAQDTDEWGKILSWSIVVNSYCEESGIEYCGAHYIWVKDEGVTADGKRKVTGQRRIPNPTFKTWHYLLYVAKAWGKQNNIHLEDYGLDCCADSFNPTSLRLATKEDKEMRERIYSKWFGIKHQEVLDLVDYIEGYEEDYIDKEELMQLKLCQRLSDKERRMAAAEECAQAGVLRRKGFVLCGEGG